MNLDSTYQSSNGLVGPLPWHPPGLCEKQDTLCDPGVGLSLASASQEWVVLNLDAAYKAFVMSRAYKCTTS